MNFFDKFGEHRYIVVAVILPILLVVVAVALFQAMAPASV